MRPAPFEYIRPSSVDDALAHAGDGVFLAGGQSLVPQLKLRERQPARVVDLNVLPELDFVVADGDVLEIGAMTRYCDVLESQAVRRGAPVLCEAIGKLGDEQVRSRGTLGGNLCWGDPRANTPVALLALGARVRCVTAAGTEVLDLEEFLASGGPAGRLVSAFLVSQRPESHQGYLELSLQPQSLPIVNMAAVLAGGTDGAPVTEAHVAAGGLDQRPLRLRLVEEALRGRVLDRALVRECALAFEAEKLAPLDNVQASAAYRRKVAPVLLSRLLDGLRSRAANTDTIPQQN